jgi:beta-lactamase class A
MPVAVSRRAALAGAAALLPLTGAHAAAPTVVALQAAKQRIAAIEQQDGGRLGVAVLDTETGARIAHRGDERFAMCSTFKFLAAAAILTRVDAGKEQLGRTIPYGPADLLSYAPITKAHVGEGGMTLADLCAAALEWSDNTAANLLLRNIGGPAGVTQFARSLGDDVTRLDRTEPTLNTAISGDERDTTSPNAMLHNMQAILLGQVLSAQSRQQLETWMIDDKVSAKRGRAGLPASWRIGDKTGTGDNGTANTIAIIWPPGRKPMLATVYYTASPSSVEVREAAHAEVGRIIVDTFQSNRV